MLERLAGKVLNRFLSKYFEDEDDRKKRKRSTSFYSGVWSGFLSLENLRLRVEVVNAKLQAQGIPIELIHCSIRKLEMTVPWSQWTVLASSSASASTYSNNNNNNPGCDTCVLVFDGVHVLARMNYDKGNSGQAMKERAIAKRRKVLQEANEDLANTVNNTTEENDRKSWKEILHQHLQEGILPALVDCSQFHIRDLHIRLEDCQSNSKKVDPFAVGVVLESMHIQHDHEAAGAATMDISDKSDCEQSVIYKIAELNRLGVYWNPLECEGESIIPEDRVEQRILQNFATSEIIEALNQSISRRAVETSTVQSSSTGHIINNRVPQHVYLLQPVDGQWHAALSANPKCLKEQPAVRAVCKVSDVSFQIRDYQCLQLIRLVDHVKEHKYSLRHRRYRPTCSVHENPRAWWMYAVAAIRCELTEKHHRLRWSWGRFRRRYEARKRYCDLYEQMLRSFSPDDAAGPGPSIPLDGSSPYLTEAEQDELKEMEDGVVGDLSVQDILLYRIVVQKRLGLYPTVELSSSSGQSSWFRRSIRNIVGDDTDDDEYKRLLEYWKDWSDNAGDDSIGDATEESAVAVAVEICVDRGHLSLFSPLGSTSDQTQLRRLQEKFVEFTYTGFGFEFSLMGDYDSMLIDLCLEDFEAGEVRSNRRKYTIIVREIEKQNSAVSEMGSFDPLFVARFSKNAPKSQEYAFGIQARLRTLAVDLVPENEWIGRVKSLIQPIPQVRNVAKFWRELNMAYINSWASNRLGLLAKAETAVSEHKAIDLDIEIDCPILRISAGEDSILVADFGRADLKTEQLSGIGGSRLMRSLASQWNTPMKRSGGDGYVDPGKTDDPTARSHQYTRLPSDTSIGAGSGSGIGDRSHVGYNVRFRNSGGATLCTPLRFDESVDLDPLSERVVSVAKIEDTNTGDVESFFYDTYELQIQTNGIRIETPGSSTEVIFGGIEARATLHRSIIPADHTLCRYKVGCVVEDILLNTSASQILFLGSVVSKWASIVSMESTLHGAHDDFMENSERSIVGPLSPEILTITPGDSSHGGSDFDEAEFFDAAEDGSYASDHVSVLMDENWITDSESVVDSETRSVSPSRRRRPRQSSISEVSSLSEGSTTRRRLHFPEGEHLTAENLARLEEEGPDETGNSKAESFHSAVSLSHLTAIAHELEQDIVTTEASVADARNALSQLRHLGDDGSQESANLSNRNESKRSLRLDLDRLLVELNALKAAHDDIVAQMDCVDGARDVDNASILDREGALHSVRAASALIQSMKKRDRKASTSGREHSMTHGLKRELVYFSLVLSSITLQFHGLSRQTDDDKNEMAGDNVCALDISNAAVVLRRKIGETKAYTSVDNIALYLQEGNDSEERRDYLLIGGTQDSLSGHLFTARFPEFQQTSSGEEKLLKAALDLRQGITESKSHNSFNVGKLRVNIGEIECTLKKGSLLMLQRAVSLLRNEVIKSRTFRLKPEISVQCSNDCVVWTPQYFDIALRLASVRAVVGETRNALTALLLSDTGARFVASVAKQVQKDKGRMDGRCGNLQLIHVAESGNTYEVLGKRDLYCPFLRFRAKVQAVPRDLNGGWVLDQAGLTKTFEVPIATFGQSGENDSSECSKAWNFHIGIKVDSIRGLALPFAIAQLKGSIESLLDLRRDAVSPVVVPPKAHDTPEVWIGGHPVRWRADLSLKDLTVCMQGTELATNISTHESIEIFFSMVATAQLSRAIDGGVILNGEIRNFSISRIATQWTIVKPMSIGLTLEAKTLDKLCSQLSKPQFQVPNDFPWRNWIPEALERTEVSGDQYSESISVVMSPLDINISASICVAFVKIIQSLHDVFSHPKPTKRATAEVVNSSNGSSKSNTSKHTRRLQVKLDQASVFVFLGRATYPLARLSLLDVELSSSQLAAVLTNLFSVSEAALVDFSSKPGVRGFGIESGPNNREANPAVALSCEITKISDQYEGKLDCRFGRIQCLLLPALVRSLLAFKKDIELLTAAEGASTKPPANLNKQTRTFSFAMSMITSLSLCVRAETFELILSSKDIPKYVRDGSNAPVGAVAIRFKVDVRASLKVLTLKSNAAQLSDPSIDSEDWKSLEEVFAQRLQPKLKDGDSYKVMHSDFDISVRKFQALRTAIVKSESHPQCFFVSPPAEGEQRITNSFSFDAKQRAAVVFFPQTSSVEGGTGVCISHAIQLQSEFIDVLVYISQSAGGWSDAMRVTIQPTIDIVKEEKSRHSTKDKPSIRRKGFRELVLEACATVSGRAKGVKVTLVPGGATRLTESPIIKFECSNLTVGAAATPVTGDVKLLSETSLETMASVTVRHLVAGLWLNCELSASYHNRRLVAWEPVIEPWTLGLQIGADLVRVFQLRPIISHLDMEQANVSPAATPLTHLEAGGRKLRDLGRLLRSPFSTDALIDAEIGGDQSDLEDARVDFCYLFLSFFAKKEISSAQYSQSPEDESASLQTNPGSTPMSWLQMFGFPALKECNGKTSPSTSFVCWVSDKVPLNVNLTGALIENLSEYAATFRGPNTRRLAPHWIRNDSGLTIRFHEILDQDRVCRNEKAKKVILRNGREAPLSLKRSLSQSCDPHQAYIALELGNYVETVGRVNEGDLDISRGSRSSIFCYRVTAKVPVDTVGVHRCPLDWNVDRRREITAKNQTARQRSLGWVIVRVALHGGIKMVSIESPLSLRNTSDIDLLCEVRDHGGLSLLWRCLVPSDESKEKVLSYSVPADVVPSIHGRSFRFGVVALPKGSKVEHEADVSSIDMNAVTRISPPPPYSSSSFGKGVVESSNTTVRVLKSELNTAFGADSDNRGALHLNLCFLRIGSFSLDHSIKGQHTGKTAPAIPEQRMLVFRSPLMIRNHLALSIRLQVRARDWSTSPSESSGNGRFAQDQSLGWADLGVLGCSEYSRWAGALPTEEVEIRIRIVGHDGGISRQFPSWSTPVIIPSGVLDADAHIPVKLKVFDSSKVPLLVSIALDSGDSQPANASSFDDIRKFSDMLPAASRVVSLYCPFWIVDSTGLDLQYKTRMFVPGQVEATSRSSRDGAKWAEDASTLGLGELLDDSDLIYLPSRISFQVLMIGDEGSARLFVRRRLTRAETSKNSLSSWSDPIPLTMNEQSYHDTSVLPPPGIWSSGETVLGKSDVEEPFALRSHLVRAPDALGGSHGTKLIHVVCRYAVVNELGREIEICGSAGRQTPVTVTADCRPRPFHFDDSGSLRFRPKEFGWLWSGRFNILRNRREMILRLKHKLKGTSLIVNVEVHSNSIAGTCIIVFRAANHAPYRIENHTMYPLEYRQVPNFLRRLIPRTSDEESSKATVILPFHNTEFAWDEPEFGRRSISLRVAEFGESLNQLPCSPLGNFRFDNIAPGTELSLPVSSLVGRVVADGPTRVLRISERSAPDTTSNIETEKDHFHKADEVPSSEISSLISIKCSHGLGVSIVDWSPQELVYVCLNEISFKHRKDGSRETVELSVGSIMADNQLWVSPYPVLLRMGSRLTGRRNKRNRALSLSWSRSLAARGGNGDFTMLENATLSTLPSIVSVDGNLAASVIEMIRRVKEIGKDKATKTHDIIPRNKQLRMVLGIDNKASETETSEKAYEPKKIVAHNLYSAVDYMATGAIAAKLRSHYQPPDQVSAIRRSDTLTEDATLDGLLSKPRHKIYIERFRVSTMTAEISWSGPLPIAASLPGLLRPALTFEGLPFLLRPYSSVHTFGSVEEHMQDIKSHYISVWRIMDLVWGVATRPMFLIRACIFTWRESCASVFSSIATSLGAMDKSLESAAVKLGNEDWRMPYTVRQFCQKVVVPTIRFNGALLGGLSRFSGASSAFLRYDAARHRARGGLVRSRNPRLFATINGNDLLVEYVEGENAGKALLSRVRMGAYLGEGYVYHVEGVRFPRARSRSETDMDSSALILMLTFERVLLLNGKLDAAFCEVIWEAAFVDLVRVEHKSVAQHDDYDQVFLWYLVEPYGSKEERYARSLVSETGGLETLHSKLIFIPAALVKALLSKLNAGQGAASVSKLKSVCSASLEREL